MLLEITNSKLTKLYMLVKYTQIIIKTNNV